MLHNAEFGEGLLQHFEIYYELVVKFSFPVYFVHRQLAWIENVDQLAVDSSGAKLLNLSYVHL